MTPEEKLLFTCTRQKFCDFHQDLVLKISANEKINWESVCTIAQSQGVAPLIYINLLQCTTAGLEIPKEILAQFKQHCDCCVRLKNNTARTIIEILSFFNERSIDIMLMTGAALDLLVYECPWYTVSHDVDLILKPKMEDLEEQDIVEIRELFRSLSNEYKYYTDQYKVEYEYFEYDYFEHRDTTLNSVLPVGFQRIWNDAVKLSFFGQDVFVMSPEDILITACINSFRKRFFRLKNLCDVAETATKYSDLESTPEINWDGLIRKARDYQCSDIVYAALFVAKTFLRYELNGQILDSLTTNPVKTAVTRFLGKHMSFSSLSTYSDLYSGKNLFSRKVDLSLLLPYVTLRGNQRWRKAKFVWDSRCNHG